MSERQIINRIKKLQALEAQRKELEDQIDRLKMEIKTDMEENGVEQQQAGDYLIRWKEVPNRRLDEKALKKALPDVYSRFMKVSVSRRFTIA